MSETGRSGLRARVVHAIPGRLRLRFEGDHAPLPDQALGLLRLAPGVLAVEARAASRSAIVRYDPAMTTEAAVLAELQQAGIRVGGGESPSPPDPLSLARARGSLQGWRDARGRFVRGAGAAVTGGDVAPEAAGGAAASQSEQAERNSDGEQASKQRSELLEMLIGPPPKFDRRLAESLALSAVSIVGARQAALAFGGGVSVPAYFAIWFALRRLTGLGRRR